MHGTSPNARLSGIISLGHAMNAARCPEDMAESAAEEVRHALPAASVAISRIEPGAVLRTLVNVGDLAGWEERRPEHETYPVEECEVLRDPATLAAAVYDRDDPACPPWEAELLRRCGKRTSLNVAILYSGRAWGELCATRGDEDPPFTSADLTYAEAVAGFIALAFAQGDHVAQVSRLVVEDPLTGLGNRRAADAALDVALDRHRGSGAPVAVVLCDVNDLKQVNDRLGHIAGDELLRRIGAAVAQAAAEVPGALACRIGGDEFCLIAPVGHAEAARLGARVGRDARRWPGDVPLAVGVAASDSPGLSALEAPSALLRLADAAQYRAKRTRASEPVVAGLGLPQPGPGLRAGRRTGGRVPPVVEGPVLALAADVLSALQAAAADHRPGPDGERERLVTAARAAARASGASAWYLALAGAGDSVVRTVAGTAFRRSDGRVESEVPGPVGLVWTIEDYPLSAAALSGGGFAVRADQLDADPAELAVLDGSGHDGVIGAGVTAPSGTRWLLEIYVDALSRPVPGLEHVLPGLLAMAVLPLAAPAAPSAHPALSSTFGASVS